METGVYVLLAAVVYGALADWLDRLTDRDVEQRRRPAVLTAVSGDLPTPTLEKPSLRDILRPRNRRVVREHRLATPAKAAQQVSPDRVKQVIPIQPQLFDDCESSSRPTHLSNNDRTIQRDDRARRNRHLLVI